MDKLKFVVEEFFERWVVLSFAQKITMGTVILVIAIIGFFLFQQSQSDYDVLYSNLNLSDAAAIVAKLKDEGKPFKLADGGTTILVPAGQKNGLVLDTVDELSGESAINLTQIPPVVSGDIQKEWIKTLNTNAIVAVLKSIRGVKDAKVIVSTPPKSLFLEDEEPTRASVLLMVEPGLRLREEQIKTIKALVAHAVPGLEEDNVAIADNAGNSLEGAGGGGGVISTADLRTKHFEKETARKVKAMLAPVVGKENVVVTVSADLNFDRSKSRIHRVIPAGGDEKQPVGVAISRQTQTERYNGEDESSQGGGGIGADANLPSYSSDDPNAQGKDSKNYEFGKTTTNFEVSKEDKTIEYAPGHIERLTVAVVLNKVLTAQETEEIKDLVANAGGLDYARGDSVDIKGFQFTELVGADAAKQLEAAEQAQERAFWIQLATVISVGLVIIIASLLFYQLVKSPASKGQIVHVPQPTAPPEPIIIETPPEMEAFDEPPPLPIIETKLDPEVEQMRDAIGQAIEADPDDAARLLVSYMRDY